MDIAKVDKNFLNTYSFNGMRTYNVNDPVFHLYGMCREEGEQDFKRLPHSLPPRTGNDVVQALYRNTSGIRVRFRTDSKRIVLQCVFPGVTQSTNMSFSGSAGFDMYADGHYCSVFHPGINSDGGWQELPDYTHGYASGQNFTEKKMRDILINFPLYNDVTEVYIALEEDAQLLPAEPYRYEDKPVVFYGSSITQGGCASHPGSCYSHMISRRYDTDILNLGFSGGCRAEPELGAYIASLPMSVFVYDYDHNAPDPEHLERTHYPLYQQVRAAQPALPIIMVSAADWCMPEHERRRRIILDSYQKALDAGDQNVYFVDGNEIYKDIGADYCLVDWAHPNDMGFWCMANAIGPVVGKCLEENG